MVKSVVIDWIPVLSLLVSLVAVMFGPLIQIHIANKQIKATNISSKRQVWIDELRTDIAKFLQYTARIEELKRSNLELTYEDRKAVFDERAESEFRAGELAARIRLRLNPNEDAHQELYRALAALAETSAGFEGDETADQRQIQIHEFNKARDRVITLTQRILKSEWNRVRKGE